MSKLLLLLLVGIKMLAVRYGKAQEDFIAATRRAVAVAGADFFRDKDWTCISPPIQRGRKNACLNNNNQVGLLVDSFYVKSIAVWMPHLLIPNHVPSCPNCAENPKRFVRVNEAEFIDKPKLLYGVRNHRCVDTYSCGCDGCDGTFYGYNEDSLTKDANALIGLFCWTISH